MKIRDWLVHLPGDAIRNAVEEYRITYEQATKDFAGSGKTDLIEAAARHQANIFFIAALMPALPKEENEMLDTKSVVIGVDVCKRKF